MTRNIERLDGLLMITDNGTKSNLFMEATPCGAPHDLVSLGILQKRKLK